MSKQAQPRGIRNNNPGNIEHNPATQWQGLAYPPHDGRFCIFETPAHGIRAIARVLITYQDKRRAADGSAIDTVAEVINRWAPGSENDTWSYIHHVCLSMGLEPNAPIDVHRYAIMRGLVEGIILHENGVMPYAAAQIDKGLAMAGIVPPDKPLNKSRTVKGAQIAAGGTIAAAAADPAAEILSTLQGAADQVQWLIPYMDTMKWVFVALTLAGIGWAVWARIDDKNKGLR